MDAGSLLLFFRVLDLVCPFLVVLQACLFVEFESEVTVQGL